MKSNYASTLLGIFLVTALLFAVTPWLTTQDYAFAGEPVAEVPAEPVTKVEAPVPEAVIEKPVEEPKEASKLWNPSLWEAVAGIIVLIWGLIVGWAKLKDKEGTKKKITMAFEAAVQDTYTELIRDLKKSKEDGKLTKDEVKQAQQMAWSKAKDILQAQGIDLGKEVIVEYGPVLVTKIVQLFKKKD